MGSGDTCFGQGNTPQCHVYSILLTTRCSLIVCPYLCDPYNQVDGKCCKKASSKCRYSAVKLTSQSQSSENH